MADQKINGQYLEKGIYFEAKPLFKGIGNTYHSYLVYRDGSGNAEVIRGGPEGFSELTIKSGVNISNTRDSYSTFPIEDRIIIKLDLGSQNIEQVWNKAVSSAKSIDPRIDFELNTYENIFQSPSPLFSLFVNVANIAINNQIILPENAQVCHSVTGTVLTNIGVNIDDVLEQANISNNSVNGIKTNLLDIDKLDIGYIDQLTEKISSLFNIENKESLKNIIEEQVEVDQLLYEQYNKSLDNNSSLVDWLKQNDTTIKLDTADQGVVKNLKDIGVKQVEIDNKTYTIQKGDTLYDIAKENNTTVDNLIENNPWLNEENRISEDKSFVLIKPEEKLNLTVDDKTISYGIDDNNSISAEYQIDLINKSVISLKEGQTISHIAQNTPFSSIDLLEYNNLSQEEAKNLPVGYKILLPKEPPLQIEGEYGVIKLFKNQNDTFTLRIPDENNNKTNITYNDNTDLLIYGDNTNPNKISFILNGRFEVWEKDERGVMYLKKISTEEFDILYKMQENKKVLEKVEIKTDNLDVEKIGKYIDFSKEELKQLNDLREDNVLKINRMQMER
ncbi:hypothetical protein CRU99_12720 [Malaciobacter mytili]|uniref:LysM peptidoglycan-binding domain-containing protein n=3 Tax=Malaciobacter mytili TaxID=603050 RepID=UPI00100A6AB5|nr:LysM domain-containing protein [Malaciobacter mytili]RXI37035.1 hypothetical protein CRU99_12720 [Malaciobacter mytili]